MCQVYCIAIDCTTSNVSNLVTTIIQASFSKGYRCIVCSTVADSYTVGSNFCIAYSYAVQTFKVFSQTNFQVVRAIGYNTDIVFCSQFGCFCDATFNVYLFTKFFIDYVTGVSTEFHAFIDQFFFSLEQLATINSICRCSCYSTIFYICNSSTISTFQCYLSFINNTVIDVVFNSTICQFIYRSLGCNVINCNLLFNACMVFILYSQGYFTIVVYLVGTVSAGVSYKTIVSCTATLLSNLFANFFQLIFSRCTTGYDRCGVPALIIQVSHIITSFACMFRILNSLSAHYNATSSYSACSTIKNYLIVTATQCHFVVQTKIIFSTFSACSRSCCQFEVIIGNSNFRMFTCFDFYIM